MTPQPWWVRAFQFAGLGWYVAVCIVGGTLGGGWLDERVGTSPLFLLLGLLFGLVLAFYGVYQMAANYFGGRNNSKD